MSEVRLQVPVEAAPNSEAPVVPHRPTLSGGTTRGASSQSPQESAAVLQQIRQQVEWYFTDANLATDLLMHDRICKATISGGWLSGDWLIAASPRLQDLHATPARMLLALRGSHLEMQARRCNDSNGGEGSTDPYSGTSQQVYIRRRQPLPPLLRRDARGVDGKLPKDLERALVNDPHQTMNRLRDQRRVQESLGLCEVGDSATVFRERIPSQSRRKNDGRQVCEPILAVGYERVLYGDGGAYIEVRRDQVRWDAWPHFFNKNVYHWSYYDEYYTVNSHALWRQQWDSWSSSPSNGVLMLYAQRAPVDDRPWAPGAGGIFHQHRPFGYADYRPGYFYFAADDTLISTVPPATFGPCAVVAPRLVLKPTCWGIEDVEDASSTSSESGCTALSSLASSAFDSSASTASAKANVEAEATGATTMRGSDCKCNGRELDRTVLHNAEEYDDPSVCWSFRMGRCQRGGQCKWKHSK